MSRVGFEPTTHGLKVRCSTAELPAHVCTKWGSRLPLATLRCLYVVAAPSCSAPGQFLCRFSVLCKRRVVSAITGNCWGTGACTHAYHFKAYPKLRQDSRVGVLRPLERYLQAQVSLRARPRRYLGGRRG